MNDITVISKTQHIIVDPESRSVSVTHAGPMGPTGPTGPPGGTAQNTTIVDAGGFYASSEVEGALQEIGAKLADILTRLAALESA